MKPDDAPALAYVGGRLATGLQDVTSDPTALDSTGFWVVVLTYEGELTCARFEHVRPAAHPTGVWRGPSADGWTTSLDRLAYEQGVETIRGRIATGEVYQANLCRVMSADLPDAHAADIVGLGSLLGVGNPAPYAATVRLPASGLHVASASPELFLRREGSYVESMPIKGTARAPRGMLAKDFAENVMIVDLVRNDLARVCLPGSVWVPSLCAVEAHPGLVHLVSTVRGELAPDVGWPELLDATFPPGSVTGAPKYTACRVIDDLEPVPRGPYCGAIGWVDADSQTGALAVAIRTFWLESAASAPCIRFGTGAGITWGSDAAGEWAETELKAARLLAVAGGMTD